MKNKLFVAIAAFVLGFWIPYLSLDGLVGYLAPFLLCLYLAYRKKALPLFLMILVGAALLSGLPLWLFSGEAEEVTGIVIYSRDDYYLIASWGQRYYVYSKGHGYEVGDILTLEGYCTDLSIAHYEGRFDFGEYLRLKGINGRFYVSSTSEVFLNPIRLKEARTSFISNFSEDAGALLNSLLFGIKDYDVRIISLGEEIGAMYFLSSSGFYFALLLKGVEKLFGLKFSERTSKGIALGFGLLMMPLAFSKVGMMRVFLIRAYSFFDFKKRGRAREYAAITLLAIDPYNALNSGFLTGFAISYFMAMAGPMLKAGKEHKKLYAQALLALLLLPSLSGNGELHLLAFFFSFILVPLYFPFLVLGLISFVTVPFASLLNGYASFLSGTMEALSKIDAVIPFIALDGYQGLYYTVLFVAFYLAEVGFKKYLPKAGLGLASIIAISLLPIGNGLSAKVSFIDVGQGDSILIRNGTKAVLVDTGGVTSFDMAEEVLIPYLRRERVYSLEGLIITHSDYDHYGAATSLLENFKVSAYLDSHSDFPFYLGSMRIDSLNAGGFSDTNDNSLVLRFNLGGDTYLLAGDIESSAETKLVSSGSDLSADILKVAHHGSSTSTSAKFLSAVDPDIAVISCGENNSYGHPDETVLARLESNGVTIRRTDLEGTVSFTYLFRQFRFSFIAIIPKIAYVSAYQAEALNPVIKLSQESYEGVALTLSKEMRSRDPPRLYRVPP